MRRDNTWIEMYMHVSINETLRKDDQLNDCINTSASYLRVLYICEKGIYHACRISSTMVHQYFKMRSDVHLFCENTLPVSKI